MEFDPYKDKQAGLQTPPSVRAVGCSIELTCNFLPDRQGTIMVEGTRDVVKIVRIA